MFTGLVETTGTVIEKEGTLDSLSLLVESPISDFKAGESVSVDGVCLTALNPVGKRFRCDLSSETLLHSRFRDLPCGASVNLERALRLSDRIGGHWVTGHVDQVCRVLELEKSSRFVKVSFGEVCEPYSLYLLKKGSIAVNGVSLTLNEVSEAAFEVMLIPETLVKTNLSRLKVGDLVNIEYDWMAKMVVEKLKFWKDGTN